MTFQFLIDLAADFDSDDPPPGEEEDDGERIVDEDGV